MTADVYKAPESDILIKDSVNMEFYVVSSSKFFILYFTTMGMYSLYWFYKHWAQYKAKHNEDMIPVLRAIFAIFFTHSLFYAIESRLKEIQSTRFLAAGTLATIYVVLVITDTILSRLPIDASPVAEIISLIIFPVSGWILYKAQVAANIACDDDAGASNCDITSANILWIILGLAVWGFAGFVLFTLLTGQTFE